MEERNTISYEEKERKKDQKMTWKKLLGPPGKPPQQTKAFFSKGGKKNQMVPDFLKITPSNTTMEHLKKTQGNIV